MNALVHNKLKAGIVGYGYMGQIRKIVVHEHPGLELSGICDANLSLIESDLGCPIFRDYRDLLDCDVDIIFVCTPNAFSPEIVINSLNKKKHVFCEKPPGRTVDDINDIIKAEQANAPAKLMFGFNHRYHPCVNEAKVLVDSGRFGKILSLRGVYGKSGGLGFEDSWRNRKEISGGGILLDQGIHMMDLFRLFCGDFQEVKGFIANSYWNIQDLEDNAFAVMRNEQGQVAMLHSSATLWKHTFRLEVFMEKGYFVISGLLSKTGSYGRETLVVGKRQFEDETFALGNPREEVTYFDRDLSWITEVSDFVDCIQNDRCVTNSSSDDALKVMELIDRIYSDDPKY